MRGGNAIFVIVSLLASMGASSVEIVGPKRESSVQGLGSFCIAKFISPTNKSILNEKDRKSVV